MNPLSELEPCDVAPPATVSVSVIVPAYGHADYIVASLESALAQVPAPHEVIVVDDGSPDDTAARIEPLVCAGRVRYVRQPNAGMAVARNAGARLATGEYLYFLDDDDLMFPGALAWMVDELQRHTAAAMVSGQWEVFTDHPPERPTYWEESREVDRVPFMLFNQLGSPGQVLLRRSAFEAVGGFEAGIWGADDWDLWLRLLARYPARSAERPVLAYRQHAQNASRDVARLCESSLHTARRGLRLFPARDRNMIQRFTYGRLRRYHTPLLVRMAYDSARRGAWDRAARAARAWVKSWLAEAWAVAALKARLALRGRRSLPDDYPLKAVILRYA